MRLDFGTIYDKYRGETERKLRESMNTADVMSPCVLWIDEIEKGIADSMGGFSGAEIEQAVVAALYLAHAKQQPLATEHIQAEIEQTKPLSVVMREKISSMRAWAEGRTVRCD